MSSGRIGRLRLLFVGRQFDFPVQIQHGLSTFESVLRRLHRAFCVRQFTDGNNALLVESLRHIAFADGCIQRLFRVGQIQLQQA